MKSFLLSIIVFGCFASLARPQDLYNPKPDERFKTDLLVVVAHPDDETEIGAYLARAIFDEKKRVAVVFGTRGNQGGDAEGSAQSAALGVIREIEARQALAHFGVTNVWFLNGLDTPGQNVLGSLETWGHGDSLERLVRIVRLTRPSVVATWLPVWVAGENHGDHQAASIIANEAFDLAGNPTAFPEQIAAPKDRSNIGNLTEGLRPWQPEKLYFFSDTSHPETIKGKGPSYSSTDTSPSRHVSYARLGAEECAFHLTQGDSGQVAKAALEKNDLHFFETPVLFVFGKSLVPSSPTDDLFAGIVPAGVPYQSTPGYIAPKLSALTLELGGPWNFYSAFWQAHGLDTLPGLIAPEIQAKPANRFVIPVIVQNPTSSAAPVNLSVELPEGWSFVRRPPASFTVDSQSVYNYVFEAKTASSQKDWKVITISAESAGKPIGTLRIRVELDPGAMPE
jgi:LmbE family N-acetylglucosaminyl deacetylase